MSEFEIKKQELKPDRRPVLYAIPYWVMWFGWAYMCLLLTGGLGLMAWQAIIWHDWFLLAVIPLFLVAAYYMSSGLIATPVTLTAPMKLLQKDYFGIESSHRKVLKLLQSLPVPKDATFAILYVNIALGQLQRGMSESAESNLMEALKYVNEKKKAHRAIATIAYCNLGCAFFRQMKIEKSIESYNHALHIVESMPRFYDAYKVVAYTGLGSAYTRASNFSKAAEYFQNCLELTQKKCKALNKKTIPAVKFHAHTGLALCHARAGEQELSRQHYGRMMECLAENINCGDANCGFVLSELANVYMDENDLHRAEGILHLAYNWCSKQPMHPESQLILDSLERYLRLTNRESEIADMRRWIHLVPLDTQVKMEKSKATATLQKKYIF